MTPTLRLIPLLAVSVLAGCRAAPGPVPIVVRTSAHVVQLGRDTIAVEQFTHVGNRVEGTLVTRAPRTTVTRYAVTLNPDGTPSSVETTVRLPDGTLVPGASRSVAVAYVGDSVFTTVQRDTAIRTRIRAPGAFPYINYAAAFFQLPLNAMLAARRDSLVTAILPVGGRTTTPLTIRSAGPNRYVADLFGSRYEIRTDSGGVVQSIDGTGTTQQFLITRRNAIDVSGIAAAWAERERQTQGMGMLSPRDTARGMIGAAAIHVDYSRPAARGRDVFGASGVLNDTLWRTGANAATQFWTNVPVRIGDRDVPAGKYTLWTLAVADRYALIVNRQTGQWGTVYDAAQDLARIPLAMSALTEYVERFTIVVEPVGPGAGVLRLRWTDTELSVPISVP